MTKFPTAYPANVFAPEAAAQAYTHVERIAFIARKAKLTPEDLDELAASVPSATCYWDAKALGEGKKDMYNVSGVVFGVKNSCPFVICSPHGTMHWFAWSLFGEDGFLSVVNISPAYHGHRFLRMHNEGSELENTQQHNGFQKLLNQCGVEVIKRAA